METTPTIRKRSNFSKIATYLKEVSAVKYNFPKNSEFVGKVCYDQILFYKNSKIHSFSADGTKFKAKISSIYDLENGLICIFRPE